MNNIEHHHPSIRGHPTARGHALYVLSGSKDPNHLDRLLVEHDGLEYPSYHPKRMSTSSVKGSALSSGWIVTVTQETTSQPSTPQLNKGTSVISALS